MCWRSWVIVAGIALVALGACGNDASTPGQRPEAGATNDRSADDGNGGKGGNGGDSGLRTITIRVAGGRAQTAQRRVDLSLGDRVRIDVTADVSDEIHVHGYDEKVETEPGHTVAVAFEADIPGVFEVELESSGLLLVELQVK